MGTVGGSGHVQMGLVHSATFLGFVLAMGHTALVSFDEYGVLQRIEHDAPG